MKIAGIIVRILMGLLFLFASVVFLLNLIPQPELKGNMKVFMDGITASRYLMPTVKVVELVCSFAFLSGRFVALAAVMLFPITLNIFLFSVFVAPENLPVGIFVLLGNVFLAYVNREKYRPMLAAK